MKKEIWFILLCLAVIGVLATFLFPVEPFAAVVFIAGISVLIYDVAISMRANK